MAITNSALRNHVILSDSRMLGRDRPLSRARVPPAEHHSVSKRSSAGFGISHVMFMQSFLTASVYFMWRY